MFDSKNVKLKKCLNLKSRNIFLLICIFMHEPIFIKKIILNKHNKLLSFIVQITKKFFYTFLTRIFLEKKNNNEILS